MILTLKGLTGHGKNRIREHGDKWEVLELPPGVMEMDPKPVLPPIKSLKTGEWRWLDDTNFSWIPCRFQLTNPDQYVILRYNQRERVMKNLKFTLNSDFGTLSSLFDSKSEAESRADAYRKSEPDTKFWVEEFPTAGELNYESCGGEF